MKTTNKLLPILFLAITLITTSCLKNDNASPDVPRAALRIVNAYTNAESIVFTEDNNYITSPGQPLRYNEYTTNLALLYPGNKRIRVYDNQNVEISDVTINLKDSTYYTSFVFGNSAEAKNLITTDVSLTNLGTNSAIRFLHLANNIANVNVYFNEINNAIYENRQQELSTSTIQLGTTSFKAHTSGKQKVIITDLEKNKLIEREYDFVAGRYYSILLTGDKNSTTKPLYIGIILQ